MREEPILAKVGALFVTIVSLGIGAGVHSCYTGESAEKSDAITDMKKDVVDELIGQLRESTHVIYNGESRCNGVAVGPHTLVTAKHCVSPKSDVGRAFVKVATIDDNAIKSPQAHYFVDTADIALVSSLDFEFDSYYSLFNESECSPGEEFLAVSKYPKKLLPFWGTTNLDDSGRCYAPYNTFGGQSGSGYVYSDGELGGILVSNFVFFGGVSRGKSRLAPFPEGLNRKIVIMEAELDLDNPMVDEEHALASVGKSIIDNGARVVRAFF